MRLPKPECCLGYTVAQIEAIIPKSRLGDFHSWMNGQTVGLCDSFEWDHEAKKYVPTTCKEPHGSVVYAHDLIDFLNGRPVTD